MSELTEVDFVWTIERLAFLDASTKWKPLTSPKFSDGKFRLHIIVDLHSKFIIQLCSSISFEYSILVQTFTSDETGNQIMEEKKIIPANTQFPATVFEMKKEDFLKTGNFVGGEMSINCKIRSMKRKHQTDETAVSENHQELILNQLEEMFEKMPLSDVTFNIGGRKFAAHKTILAMRSPVLAAMFHHPTKEVQSSKVKVVKVKDVDPDVFQEVLRFIYIGKTQLTAMNEMAPNLLAAADKYQLEDLKFCCETHLIRKMSAVNCWELLSLTADHPAEYLKKYAIKFFRRHPGTISIVKVT